jgi:uncharacterized protein YjbJ (UPF0337 family)
MVIMKGNDMNWDQISGNWEQMKGSVRGAWGKLTDDEVEQVKGDRQKLAGKIQERYGIARDEAERRIDDWAIRGAATGNPPPRPGAQPTLASTRKNSA